MVAINMSMPLFCLSKDGQRSSCPLDRLWCVQEFCHNVENITMGDVYDEQVKENELPYWCPLKEVEDKVIDKHYKKGFANGIRTAEWKYDNAIAEIEQIEINGHIRDVECFRAGVNTALNILNKYRSEEGENKE